ncbi:epidermal growth factor receptor kinase substrate 8-like protein 3 [Brachionichthys hirsutus]|uniref:epidermal growth factor receptor kinase substrate 8-like protein 3 n=1 Tax=Brachionichthys hirsutus TaxID=412623 RepID=UPI0036048BB8
MFRSNSPFENDTSSYADSIQSNGYSTMDELSSQVSNVSRPSAQSIYMQRKAYAAEMNQMMNKLQYRVEHLFTCDLDGKELRGVADCVERLNLLKGMGRVWGQSMLMEVCGPTLLLTDIETKTELESMALGDILELKAVLDNGAFNSLLTVSVRPRRKHATAVLMFQCEDVRADYVQKNLSQALSRSKEDSSISVLQLSQRPGGRILTKESEINEPELFSPDGEEKGFTNEEEPRPPPRPYTALDRSVDLLNHILNDLEIFMGQVAAAVAKNGRKKKKKRPGKAMEGMPPAAEFAACLHKIKCGFNLLVELNGRIKDPTAPEFVHSLFSTVAFLLSHCSEDLPPTIVAPLLTPQCIRLMSEEASTEEDQLWQSLGDAWNIPSTKWPEDDEDIPTYTLEFLDGWQPPELRSAPEAGEPASRRASPQPAPSQVKQAFTEAEEQSWGEEDERTTGLACFSMQTSAKCSRESEPQQMRVVRDFVSRNARELTVRKGEVVQLLDRSRQWWRVRGHGGQEGFVPHNVLGACGDQSVQLTGGPAVLTKRCKAAEVKAWLEDKGFSQITVRCLGVLSGSMLLGMTREELKTVCPEEGGRVFLQLQAVKAARASSS